MADVDDANVFDPNSDSDEDGLSDIDETTNGSDPLDPCDPVPTQAYCSLIDDDNDGYIANVDPSDPTYDIDDTDPCVPNQTVDACDYDQDGMTNGVPKIQNFSELRFFFIL